MEEKKLKFRRLRGRKRANPKRGIIFILLLIVIVYLWMNAESILTKILP
ncbi:MAG: hypothetical protein P8I51_09900 [Polaribacter sp.]|jgi:hypothetical protein|nr:hypothetical protein [Polaribacter sp.]MDG1955188.1 hypothetical protein [Polaribacter sp.]MDG2073468.1 hypothetical protein [Polaribacter sp.]